MRLSQAAGLETEEASMFHEAMYCKMLMFTALRFNVKSCRLAAERAPGAVAGEFLRLQNPLKTIPALNR